MSIRSRGTRYIVDVKVGGRRTRRAAKTKSEARKLEARLRAELTQAPKRGIEECLAAYLKGEAKNLHAKTTRNNARAIRPFIKGKILEDAPQVAADMKSTWIGAGLLPATINRRLAMLRRLCNLAFEWGWTDKAIGKRIKLLSGENVRHVYLTPDEVEAIASRMPLAGNMVRFTAYTGLRLGEVKGLQKENVLDGAVVLYNTKNRRPRVVYLPERIKPLLELIPWQVTEFVRRTEWEAARVAAGLPGVRWHDLRHTYASWLAALGASDRELGDLLGHVSAQMVKRYAHLRGEHLRKRVADL